MEPFTEKYSSKPDIFTPKSIEYIDETEPGKWGHFLKHGPIIKLGIFDPISKAYETPEEALAAIEEIETILERTHQRHRLRQLSARLKAKFEGITLINATPFDVLWGLYLCFYHAERNPAFEERYGWPL